MIHWSVYTDLQNEFDTLTYSLAWKLQKFMFHYNYVVLIMVHPDEVAKNIFLSHQLCCWSRTHEAREEIQWELQEIFHANSSYRWNCNLFKKSMGGNSRYIFNVPFNAIFHENISLLFTKYHIYLIKNLVGDLF